MRYIELIGRLDLLVPQGKRRQFFVKTGFRNCSAKCFEPNDNRWSYLTVVDEGVWPTMKSSQIITLFTEPPPPRTAPSSFVVSMVVHVAVFGPLLVALKHTSRLSDRPVAHRYTVRLLDQRRTETQTLQYVGKGAAYPVLQTADRATAVAGSLSKAAYIPPRIPQLLPASQTLIQPEAPPDLQLPQETPIPALAVWSRDSSINKKIVPPAPREPAVADVRPSVTRPNYETTLAELNISISPAALPTETPSIPSSTTTPIVVRGPETVKLVPQTESMALEQPTPARVISLSTLQTQGPVVIPMANETSRSDSTEALAARQPEKAPGNGHDNQDKQDGVGAERSADEKDNAIAARGALAQSAANIGSPQGVAIGPDTNHGDVTRISLPKDGKFGVVVVGSSMAEQYPETVEIWRGRLVYTVYLQVGLGKNWILQYSIPRSGATAGTMSSSRPEAPWPFEILSPHLAASDYNSDAILVHGFVNLAGRFEGLAVVFPPEFTQPKFLLGALQQWQFRAARQDGQPAATEVLLIIPAQID
jgi:hypothetical protein